MFHAYLKDSADSEVGPCQEGCEDPGDIEARLQEGLSGQHCLGVSPVGETNINPATKPGFKIQDSFGQDVSSK